MKILEIVEKGYKLLKIVNFVESGQKNVVYYINVGYVAKKVGLDANCWEWRRKCWRL